MNKKNILPKTALVLAAFASVCLTANAMPLVVTDQSVGLVGRPIAQLPIQDPQVEQAIDLLKSKQLKPNQLRKVPANPETVISRSHRKNLDKVLILGGAENIPM